MSILHQFCLALRSPTPLVRLAGLVLAACWAGSVQAEEQRHTGGNSSVVFASVDQAVELARGRDVILLGEIHDNSDHHKNQAHLVRSLSPNAVVWEMITQEQADKLTPDVMRTAEDAARVLGWEASGWPDFAMYAPVFHSASVAAQYGALVPRSAASDIVAKGGAAWFGPAAADFGLDQPLPEAAQKQREAEQQSNHCNAMPPEMLPLLVDYQRLRDTVLAEAVVRAIKDTGGPVVVITGNGHARKDRGVPVYLENVRPDLSVLVVGQAEDAQISGLFDIVLDAPAVPRSDPCLAFAKENDD